MSRKITLFLIFVASFAISSSQGVKRINQVEGVYLGRVEDGYSFCCKTGSGIEQIIVFDEVLSVILEKHPLHLDEQVGENFMVSFVKNFMVGENSSAEILTIVRLQKLKPGKHN